MLCRVRRLLKAIAWLSLEVLQVTRTVIIAKIALLLGVYMFCKGVARYVFSSPSKEKSLDQHELVTSDSDVAPIVLVHGVFGFGEGRMGGMPYFGGIENMHQRIFNPDLGSLTSLYDRARQLFYYLKGGRVDYCEEHSKAYGHSQFGRVYEQGKTSQYFAFIMTSYSQCLICDPYYYTWQSQPIHQRQ